VLLGRRGDEFFAIGASCTHGNKGRSPNAWSWTTRCGVPARNARSSPAPRAVRTHAPRWPGAPGRLDGNRFVGPRASETSV